MRASSMRRLGSSIPGLESLAHDAFCRSSGAGRDAFKGEVEIAWFVGLKRAPETFSICLPFAQPFPGFASK